MKSIAGILEPGMEEMERTFQVSTTKIAFRHKGKAAAQVYYLQEQSSVFLSL